MKINKVFIAMVADKEECLSIIPNTYTISSCLHEMTDDKIKVKMSGKLLLMFAILSKQCTKISGEKVWNKDDYEMVRKCKPNIMNSFHHHGSISDYFAFGNKKSFGMIN